VLDWLIPRRQALLFLGADLETGSSSSSVADFSPKELKMINDVLEDSQKSYQFWATCHLCMKLSSWGASVSKFFHSCPVASHFHADRPCKMCVWKGRMAVRLAQGSWMDEFSQNLLNLPLGQARSFLNLMNLQNKSLLENDYNSCKVAMAQRFLQVFSFWRDLPWRICALGIPLFDDMSDPQCSVQYIQSSKAFAREVMEQWDATKNEHKGNHSFHMAQLFLDSTFPSSLRAYMVYWASSPQQTMPHVLACALMKYCSALTVMQSLEAQHHYLSQRMSFGRAALPAATCAYLRRRLNGDMHHPSFRLKIDQFLGDFSKLVAIKWNKRSES